MTDVGSVTGSRPPNVSVSLSGGGHRAALFGLGVLLYIADAGRNHDVTSVASVSGGSITNGFIAQRSTAYNLAQPREVWDGARELAGTIVTKGSLMGRRPSAGLLAAAGALLVAAWLVFLIDVPLLARAGLSTALAIGAGAILSLAFRGWLPKLYVVVLLLTLSWVLAGPWLIPIAAVFRLIVLIAAMAVWITIVAGRRSWVCEKAFEAAFFAPGGTPKRLDAIHHELDHVFCATELQSSEALYFSGGFVAGYRYGIAPPGDTTLAQAVQASACLPFAFTPRWIRYSKFKFAFPLPDKPAVEDRAKDPTFLVLSDGGVYDNMATAWGTGYENRATWWPDLRSNGRAPEQLVVVNASAGKGWQRFDRSPVPGKDEFAGMLRIKDVLYDQTTAPRRRALVAAFDQAAAAIKAAGTDEEARRRAGIVGAIVDISQSPYTVPLSFKGNKDWPDRADRAKRALDALDALGTSKESWAKDSQDDAAIGTVLHRIEGEACVRLLHNAYVLAAMNLSVILDFPLPPQLPTRERFRALLDG